MYLKNDYTIMARSTLKATLTAGEKIVLDLREESKSHAPSPSIATQDIVETLGNSKKSYYTLKVKKKDSNLSFFSSAKILFSNRYLSLHNLELVDFSVDRSKRRWYTIDSKVEQNSFTFKAVPNRERSLTDILKILQFYINCEICFKKLVSRHTHALSVNRGDISSLCEYKLSYLTAINSFENVK